MIDLSCLPELKVSLEFSQRKCSEITSKRGKFGKLNKMNGVLKHTGTVKFKRDRSQTLRY